MKYIVTKSIPMFEHPRYGYVSGVDWGKEGLVLAAEEFDDGDFPKRLLVWNRGNSTSVNGSYVRYPPSLNWIHYSGSMDFGFEVKWSTIYDPWEDKVGSRFSKNLLIGLGERIAEKTGFYFDWRNWNRKETLMFIPEML